MVKTDSPVSYILRIIVMGIFIAALGLSPLPHALNSLMVKADQAAQVGDWQTAATSLAEAGQFYPWRADLAVSAARDAMQAGNPQATLDYFQRPGVADHLSNDDLILWGDAYRQTGDLDQAEATWKAAAGQDSSADVNRRLADLYLQQKNYPLAIESLKKMLQLNPANGALNYQIGLLYAVTNPVDALPFLEQAAALAPTLASHASDLVDKIRTANLSDQPAYTLVVSGRQLASIGEWVMAAAAFQHAIELDPGYADAWAFLGESRQQIEGKAGSRNSETGLAELQQALKIDPKSILANTFMSLYWERQQDFSQAQSYAERAIRLNPKDPYLYSQLGNVLSKTGDLPAAQAAYESAIQVSPQDPTFYRVLALFALENNIQIRELALPAARQAVRLNPADPESLDTIAQVMLELQDYRSAESYLQQALKSDPDYAPAYLHLGMAYVYLEESGLAYEWLAKAEQVDPGSWVASQAQRMLDYYFP